MTKAKLSNKAKQAILKGEEKDQLFCCDISLWEIAMLVQKKRLAIPLEIQPFLSLILKARQIKRLDITPHIAALSVTHPCFQHSDPANRLIGATTMHYNAKLVTCDKQLSKISKLTVIW